MACNPVASADVVYVAWPALSRATMANEVAPSDEFTFVHRPMTGDGRQNNDPPMRLVNGLAPH